jgi:hypothetical protein
MSSSYLSHSAVALGVAAALAVPSLLGAQTIRERLQVHGYLTQGFAATDSLPILGITNKGSAEHRAAALQARFSFTEQDVAVVQLANRRMGESAINDLDGEVALQWAYYNRRIGRGFSAKVGRAPMPRGIYNEVRKVGTVLPFYRAPYTFYTESYETVDGAVLRHDASVGSWGIETSVYGGSLDFRQVTMSTIYSPSFVSGPNGPQLAGVTPLRDTALVNTERGTRAVGGQLWVSTPLEGLRVGVGGNRFDLSHFGHYTNTAGRTPSLVVNASVDGAFQRFQLRGEWAQFQSGELLYTTFYAQAGVKLGERLSLNAQREQANVNVTAKPIVVGVPASALPVSRHTMRQALDHAVGLTWAFRPDVVLKAEGHDNTGINFDRAVSPNTRGRYVITSLALSF